jgi:DNA-binding beta-propeller fold protein YncE
MPLGSAFHATLNMGGGGAGGSAPAPAGVWSVANVTYDSKSFTVSQESSSQAMFFKPDGTKFYALGINSDRVYQYSCSTAWDISTASYDSASFLVSSQETSSRGLFFKDDGTKFYVIGITSDRVYQYSCSTAWNVSTASYDSVSFLVSSQEASPQDIFFKPDGTKFYVVGTGNDRVYQYSCSTAWDISTASYESKSFSVSAQELTPAAMFFKDDGTKMWMAGINDTVYQYSLSTAWDVSTASYDSVAKVVSSEASPRGLFFRPNGNAMYMIGSNNIVYQYTLS